MAKQTIKYRRRKTGGNTGYVKCNEKLAEEFDMSVRQVKTIVYKSEEKLFKHIRG